ncbi:MULTISPECIES: tryptophan--tRNA ligase [unclassified Archaeoglobus]|jgi:tryptophanyl-tRNA synthetase|uniref:tryptophan--tRNA ligase n=1 Tax=unclassified Archaeoglobus TaxID=2643606 RepID=UPI0025BBFA9D|nr:MULTISPECIES: tryptophan--tRNA ligase [unclassified Archaeoglobus]
MQVTPWDVEGVIDYDRLIEEFGMRPFNEVLEEIENPHILMKRGAIFGHRDYWRIVDAMRKGEAWAVMSGFMPSGLPHFGHKMTMDEIVWHQKAGGKAFVAIADMEAHSVRGLSWEKTREIGLEYIKSIIALGLDSNAVIYFQSKSNHVKDLAFELSAEVNFSELRAIYGFNGETKLAKMFITAVQAADILHPQLQEFGGPKPVVVPVGADQDPHMRLTRDLAARASIFSFEPIEGGLRIRSRKGNEYLKALKELNLETRFYEEHVDVSGSVDEIEREVREVELRLGGFAFIPPSSTYHRFTTGLTGGKMSSSKPESYISLLDSPDEGAKKVMKAFTGGRVTADEQRRLGGEPDKCVVFELYSYHLIENDNELRQIESNCRGGKLLCGKCKKNAAELVRNFLKEHQEKMDEAEDKLEDYTIIGL